MLTKGDLQAIKKIAREEIEAEGENTRNDLQGEIKLARIEVQKDLRDFANRLKNVEIALRLNHPPVYLPKRNPIQDSAFSFQSQRRNHTKLTIAIVNRI